MGTIYNIQRFSLHDGPGIRTTVFLKGCPLRCQWCHNPESQSTVHQLSLFAERCIGCGQCIALCGVHVLEDGQHKIRHDACRGCGRCAEQCPAAALEIFGREATPQEIVDEAARDLPFYQTSGGGITISGGEPTMQPDFAAEILALAKQQHIHTAMESCGHTSFSVLEKLLPHLDMILYDVKQMDSALHERYTGQGNQLILRNLRRLCSKDQTVEVVVRTPVIPGFNDQKENFTALRDFLLTLERIPRVEVLPYNPLAGSKYPRLGMTYTPGELHEEDGTPPSDLCDILQNAGIQAKVMR